MPNRLLLKPHRTPIKRSVEGLRTRDHFFVRAIDLDERHEMWRVERMGCDEAVRMAHRGRQIRPQERGGTACDHGFDRGGGLDLGIQRSLFGDRLWGILLDKVSLPYRSCQGCLDAQGARLDTLAILHAGELSEKTVDAIRESLALRCRRIPCRNIVPV